MNIMKYKKLYCIASLLNRTTLLKNLITVLVLSGIILILICKIVLLYNSASFETYKYND